MRDASAGPEVLRAMEHPVVRELLELHRHLEEVTWPFPQLSVRRYNALAARVRRAVEGVRAHPDVFPVLRGYGADLALRGAFDPDLPDRVDMEVLHQVLAGAVFEHGRRTEDLRADPRVGLGGDQLLIENALFLAEGSTEGRAQEERYPYEHVEGEPGPAGSRRDDPDEAHRDLSRIGGVPTAAGAGHDPDAEEFLLQLDLRALRREAPFLDGLDEVLRGTALPADGLLQVFHSTTGDSVTDPHRPGGGGALRHVPEAEVLDRRPVRIDPDDYPVSPAVLRVLPTFRPGAAATDPVFEAVQVLQDETHRAARNGAYSTGFLDLLGRNPFAVREDAVSYLFGLQAPDFDIDVDRYVLDRDLPLRDDHDRHRLFLTVAADRTFDQVFGDGGRLEFWLRASDLAQGRFDDVVTFIRST